MKDLILGFKLLKYGYKLKTNIMMLALFTLIGLAVEISSQGTNMLGGFYFMLTGMFTYQLIIVTNVSDYVQTSAMKRKLETGLPAFVSTVVYLLLMTVLVVEKYILVRMYPDKADRYLDVFFMIICILFAAMLFCGVCYKYFFASFLVFMFLVVFGISEFNIWLASHHISDVVNVDIGKVAVFGYVAVIIGGVVEYILSCLLYKKPLSDIAINGIAKGMKK